MTKTGKVICPYCGTGCQVELHVENNVIRSALGVQDNPVNQGNLCLKGFYGWDYVGASDRLTKPLIRKKDGVFSKDGDLEEASWDEALDLVVAKMKEVKEKYGPDALVGNLLGSLYARGQLRRAKGNARRNRYEQRRSLR